MNKTEIKRLEMLARAYKKLDTCLYYFGVAAAGNPEAEALKEMCVALMDDTAALIGATRDTKQPGA